MKKDQTADYNRRKFIATSAKAFAAFTILPRFVLGGKMPDGSMYTAPSDMINLGFIGTGKQGRGLTEAFLKTGQIRIAAISEVYKDKAELTINTIKISMRQMLPLVNLQTYPHTTTCVSCWPVKMWMPW